MKKVLLISLVFGLFVAAVMFAAGGQESTTGKITLTGMVRNYTLKYDHPWYSAAIALQEKYPNVQVELESLPYNDQREKTLITVGAGKGPDIAQVDCIWLGEFLPAIISLLTSATV